MTVKEKLEKLRSLMRQKNIDAYIIGTMDYHGSEFVGEYFKAREYMSGFTGSAGTLVVLKNKAALWTDGRYFIQAESQLKGSGITLMRMGMDGVPDIETYILKAVKPYGAIGFDGRCISALAASRLGLKAQKKNIIIKEKNDLVGKIWTDRPPMAKSRVWELDKKYIGMTVQKKLSLVREQMLYKNSEVFVLTSLDDIAWLLNLRADDVKCSPVFLSYMIIFYHRAYLYVDSDRIDENIKSSLKKNNIILKRYGEFYKDLHHIKAMNILLDEKKVNFAVISSIKDNKNLITSINPTTVLKAVKTKEECENERKAHIKDGVAVTKFMYWLKNNIGKEEITEISAAEKLESLRGEQEGYIEPSFEPIMAYGMHGAIVHYSATKETDIRLEKRSFLLSDTGGHYYEGTTDITRTYALGELTDEEKKMYTLVLAGNLKLAAARFPYGIRGINLDVLAREALWRNGVDFNHGTGHGVGYLLNVHEGPNNISWYVRDDKVNSAVMEEGMITSDEPGVYIEDKFGVRLENMILCKTWKEDENGKFMCFDTLTMVPFDLDAIDIKYMNSDEIRLLNEYHRLVYKNISPYLDEEEKKWLQKATRAIR